MNINKQVIKFIRKNLYKYIYSMYRIDTNNICHIKIINRKFFI